MTQENAYTITDGTDGMSILPNNNNEAFVMEGYFSDNTDDEGTCVFVRCYDILRLTFSCQHNYYACFFRRLNNTTGYNEDTITDDTDGISTPHQKGNESYGSKGKDKNSSSDYLGKVDMARVEKAVEDDSGIFDVDVTVI